MICPVVCRLEADGLPALSLTEGPIRVARLDLGDALTREVVELAPDASGTIDTTRYTGGRVVTLEATVNPHTGGVSRWELTQRLRAFTRADIRPRLFWQAEAGDPELMVTLRRSQFSDVLAPQRGLRSRVTVQWVAPSGLIESAELVLASVYPGPGGSGSSVELPAELPIELVGGGPPGVATVVNNGSANAWPVLRVYGPCGDGDTIQLVNSTVGAAMVIEGLDIAAGDYLDIDTQARTVLLNGLASQSRYEYLEFTDSSWWPLVPGPNYIRYLPDTYAAPSQLQVRYRHSWL